MSNQWKLLITVLMWHNVGQTADQKQKNMNTIAPAQHMVYTVGHSALGGALGLNAAALGLLIHESRHLNISPLGVLRLQASDQLTTVYYYKCRPPSYMIVSRATACKFALKGSMQLSALGACAGGLCGLLGVAAHEGFERIIHPRQS